MPSFAASRTGLIPAHAGSTSPMSGSMSPLGAHPRSRGEHRSSFSSRAARTGSSPLTRGARGSSHVGGVLSGLIPAHAGSTTGGRNAGEYPGAHPRSRGEHARRPQGVSRLQGSSPLTRGARWGSFSCFVGWGLIPAHAGSTSSCFFGFAYQWAHPRSRGEHFASSSRRSVSAGSSPLTRGARRGLPCAAVLRGLIPAHAGST